MVRLRLWQILTSKVAATARRIRTENTRRIVGEKEAEEGKGREKDE
jgi:hypothetical protein